MKEESNNNPQCSNPGHCKNHPIITHITDTMQIQEVCIDTVRSADTTINITEKQIFVQVPMKKDCTINYHTVSLIEPVTYETETVQVVRNKPNRQEPMTFDLPINSFLFVMATVMAVRYLATCSVSWANLINDLKHELNKA